VVDILVTMIHVHRIIDTENIATERLTPCTFGFIYPTRGIGTLLGAFNRNLRNEIPLQFLTLFLMRYALMLSGKLLDMDQERVERIRKV
jgi:hypothetical protein